MTGVVQAIETSPADGAAHVVVLMNNEGFTVHSPGGG